MKKYTEKEQDILMKIEMDKKKTGISVSEFNEACKIFKNLDPSIDEVCENINEASRKLKNIQNGY